MLAVLTCMLVLAPPAADDPAVREAIRAYAARAAACYAASAQSAAALETAIRRFCDSPDQAGLERAREAWKRGRIDYGRTEVFRFGDGPIDARRGGVETFVNAWPVDERYIEPEASGPRTGIVADRARYPVLAGAVVREHNQRGGETNVCTGWHAIEFMLWGTDNDAGGPGRRDASDFVDGAAPDADRRREYLAEIAGLLRADLAKVADAWKSDAPHRARFESGGERSLRAMFVGPALLAGFEMSGERLAVAYETRDQEEEHSCFSDTTDADFKANADGIRSVLRGSAGGEGLLALVRRADPGRADRLAAALDRAVAAVNAIPAPFDQAIRAADDSPQRAALKEAIESLEQLGDEVSASAKALGITLPTEPQG